MLNTILGSKLNMSQMFIDGHRIPVTNILAGPCIVTAIKTKERDGYLAIQIGFAEKRTKKLTRSMQGHLRGVSKNLTSPRFLIEIPSQEKPEVKIGDQYKASDIFSLGDTVSVSGISKGKGFAGVVKRYHFKGGPRTHGQSDRERAPGSIGQTTTPGRVFKGKRMAGRM